MRTCTDPGATASSTVAAVACAVDVPHAGGDLRLRPWRADDAAAFVDAVRESVATVGAWMPWCVPTYDLAQAQDWFSTCTTNLNAAVAYDIGIFAADDTTVLGGIGINQIDRLHNLGNLGYWVRQSRQRQGIAVAAVHAMAAFGFHTLGLTRLEIVAVEDNRASRGVAAKAGAAFEALARNRLLVFGQPRTAAVYALLP